MNINTIQLEYCPTEEMTADLFTKGLGREQFCNLRDMVGVIQLPEHYTYKRGGVLI